MLFDLKRSASVVGFFFQWCKDFAKNWYQLPYTFTYKMFDGKTASLVVNSDVIHAFRFQISFVLTHLFFLRISKMDVSLGICRSIYSVEQKPYFSHWTARNKSMNGLTSAIIFITMSINVSVNLHCEGEWPGIGWWIFLPCLH